MDEVSRVGRSSKDGVAGYSTRLASQFEKIRKFRDRMREK